MPRHERYTERDEAPVMDGDKGFIGVNMRLDPSQLQPGYMSEAINCRFNRGIVESRKGIGVPVWANKALSFTGTINKSGNTATFTTTGAATHGYYIGQRVFLNGFASNFYNTKHTITAVPSDSTFEFTETSAPGGADANTGIALSEGATPWGTIHGIGEYKDPSTAKEYMVIATGDGVFFSSQNNASQQIGLPAGVTISDSVTFTQAFDRLLMHRGADKSTLELRDINGSFQAISQSAEPNEVGFGTQAIPNSERSLFFQNRLFIPFGNDEVAVSDFNDYTRYLPVFQEFKVNQGSADSLVTIEKFSNTSIIAFKENSIYAINNIYGNLAAVQLDELTNRFGLAAPKSVSHVGKDLWFLSELGVMSIRQTELNQLQGVALPVSDPIQPLIDRINWKHANKAVASYWENRYYLAVPLDKAERFGREMVKQQAQAATSDGELYVTGLVVGATYAWRDYVGTETLTCGSDSFTTDADFVAGATTATISGPNLHLTGLMGASLRRLYTGVNNTVLVYDVLNQAWSGYDTADDLMVKEWVQLTIDGKRRLLYSSDDGYVRLYESAFQDQLVEPYAELTITAAPTAADTVSVNKGTAITVIADTTNTATEWACGNPITKNDAIERFFYYFNLDQPSYSDLCESPWSMPNVRSHLVTANTIGATAFLADEVFRFYATNGILPNIEFTGSTGWYTLKRIGVRDIESSCTTRLYQNPSKDIQQFSWASVDIQTWGPTYTIEALYTGVEEAFTVANAKTKDRTKWYRPFSKAAFEVTNTTGRYLDKYREDYSLLLGNAGASGEAANVRIDTVSGGVRLDLHQETRETFKLNRTSPGVRIKITNATGRFRMLATIIEGAADSLRARTEA